jgi:hypothetical protein
MLKIRDITIPPCDQTGKNFYIVNAEGVKYRSDDFNQLIRTFSVHTQQPAVDFGINGISLLRQD